MLLTYFVLVNLNFFSPLSRLEDLFNPMTPHYAIYHWSLELRYVVFSIISFLFAVSFILTLFKKPEYRRVGLIAVLSVPIFYVFILLLININFDIPFQEIIKILTGKNNVLGVYLYIQPYDLKAIFLILLGLPLVYSKKLFMWIKT